MTSGNAEPDKGSPPARYAVMGNPVEHSQSPRIHRLFAQQTGVNLSYERILVPLEGFVETVRKFREAGGRGANVTVPFKQQAYVLADQCSQRAEQAGAANTLRFDPVIGIEGDNTDGAGLMHDLQDNLDAPLNGARVLLLGAGGAARGVLGPLLERGPREVVVANRTAAKARDLAKRFGVLGPVWGCGYDELSSMPFDLVINATSAGLSGTRPPLSAAVVQRDTFCYDMVYGEGARAFLSWARDAGAGRVADGLGMLVEQAACSFEFWHGRRPLTKEVIETLRAELPLAV